MADGGCRELSLSRGGASEGEHRALTASMRLEAVEESQTRPAHSRTPERPGVASSGAPRRSEAVPVAEEASIAEKSEASECEGAEFECEEPESNHLTDQEMKEFLDIFHLVDRVEPPLPPFFFLQTKREFITEGQLFVLLETLGVSATPEEVSQMVKEIDEDGNGQIEFDEFCAVMDKRSSSGNCTPVEIKSAFRHFVIKDAPEGMIHPDDVKRCFRKYCHTLTSAQIDDLVAMGFIDYEAYVDMMMSLK